MEVYGVTHQGMVRKNNQDAFYIGEEAVGCLPNLFVLADGMGGHKAGEVASSGTIWHIVQYIKKSINVERPEEILKQAIEKANHIIYKESQSNVDYEGMGTTVIVMSIFEDKVYIAYVGDSRVYGYYKNEQGIQQITTDHSYVEELVESGAITREEAKTHPEKNVITRAVGVSDQVDVDTRVMNRANYDGYILCSDGLTDLVQEERIAVTMKRHEKIDIRIEALKEMALENGGKDNVTVIGIES